jgi:hypothetical protein
MRAYVNEKGVPPCKVSQPDVHCSAKEQDYIKAWSAKAADAVSAERARLDKMRDAKGACQPSHFYPCVAIISVSHVLRRQSRCHPLGAAAPRSSEAARVQTAGFVGQPPSQANETDGSLSTCKHTTQRNETLARNT